MPKGGARTRSGPAPDPNALARERDEGEWTVLPGSGRPGRAPVWPLPKASARERKVWADHWRMPQALMWERLGQQHFVALYVRRLVEAEESGARVNLSTLVRQMADALGLTTPGLRANRWRIEPAEVAGRSQARVARSSTGSRARLALAGGTSVDGR